MNSTNDSLNCEILSDSCTIYYAVQGMRSSNFLLPVGEILISKQRDSYRLCSSLVNTGLF